MDDHGRLLGMERVATGESGKTHDTINKDVLGHQQEGNDQRRDGNPREHGLTVLKLSVIGIIVEDVQDSTADDTTKGHGKTRVIARVETLSRALASGRSKVGSNGDGRAGDQTRVEALEQFKENGNGQGSLAMSINKTVTPETSDSDQLRKDQDPVDTEGILHVLGSHVNEDFRGTTTDIDAASQVDVLLGDVMSNDLLEVGGDGTNDARETDKDHEEHKVGIGETGEDGASGDGNRLGMFSLFVLSMSSMLSMMTTFDGLHIGNG